MGEAEDGREKSAEEAFSNLSIEYEALKSMVANSFKKNCGVCFVKETLLKFAVWHIVKLSDDQEGTLILGRIQKDARLKTVVGMTLKFRRL